MKGDRHHQKTCPCSGVSCVASLVIDGKATCAYTWHLMQVQYKVFEHSQLKPLLDVVNEEQQKEKDKEAGS